MATSRGSKASMMAVVLAVVSLVVGACLGPTQFDPTGRAPIGKLEVMVDAAGSIRVKGWALDPESSRSIVVKVGSEGIVHDVVANGNRPDVAARYPGKGTAHGFDHTFGPLSPGVHGICVWVPNTVGSGDDRLLGCSNLNVTSPDPVGRLETVTSLRAREIAVRGWAFDPNTSASIRVSITVDGKFAQQVTADGTRQDVATAYKRGSAVGFSTDLAAVPGDHQVCATMVNAGWGANKSLGCRSVNVAESTADRRPAGQLTEVTPIGGGRVRVAGAASDPDGSAGLRVRLDVDAGTPTATSVALEVTGGRFAADLIGLADGLHSICPVGLDVDGGVGVRGDRAFLCGSVVLGDVAVGTTGAPAAPTAVAPPVGNPLRSVDRDGGVSVQLRDGSLMWFFGDSHEYDDDGNLEYFVNNSAAWAAKSQPTVTRDAAMGGQPVRFAAPPAGLCPGNPTGDPSAWPKPALWPEAAVAVPQPNGTDRVVVFMSKVCLGEGQLNIEAKGMVVVETTYDPGAPPADEVIQGDVTQTHLSGVDAAFGRGAVLAPDGYIYGYHCGSFTPTRTSWGPCEVGRVLPASVTNPSAWRYWNGGDAAAPSSWTDNPALAAALTMPDAQYGFTIPVASFTVTRDPAHGAYVMVYSPWPGFTDRVEARVSTSPLGPWTAPVTVFLPGCNETSGGVHYGCYAGTAQPALSGPGLLGIGYFDQIVSVGPTRGQYLTVTVPFNVVLTQP